MRKLLNFFEYAHAVLVKKYHTSMGTYTGMVILRVWVLTYIYIYIKYINENKTLFFEAINEVNADTKSNNKDK